MRIVIVIAVIYAAILHFYIQVKEAQLTAAIVQTVEGDTAQLMASSPVLHRYTLSREIPLQQVKNQSPFNLLNQSNKTTRYELIVMSPCNPRILSCS